MDATDLEIEQDAARIIDICRRGRKLLPLPKRARAWERASAILNATTADDVKSAWHAVQVARAEGEPALFQMRVRAFSEKLASWLNG